MAHLLKVWVWVQEEELLQLSLFEEVGQVFHCVRPDARDIPVLARLVCSQRLDPVHYVVGDFNADLHAQGELVREHLAQFNWKDRWRGSVAS